MPVKIVTLVENSPGEHLALRHEHGISFYVEKDGRKLLFDLGQSGAFLENAEKLNLDVSAAEFVVVSHGHYDHSGGFRSLLSAAGNFTFVAGKGFFDEKYATDGLSYEFLGNDFDEAFLRRQGVPFRLVGSAVEELFPGVYVLSSFPRIHKDEVINPRFKVLRNGRFEPDSFDDEVLVAVETEEGMVVLLGCSHPGVKNMLDAVRGRFAKPIRAVVGGTHLVEASEASLAESLAYFEGGLAGIVGVSHCTGKEAVSRIFAGSCKHFHNRTGRMVALD